MDTCLLVGMVASGLFFGWTIGSHYTGACMGMAYGSGVIKSRAVAVILIAFFAILGATFESHNVVKTVGTGIIRGEDMTPLGAMVMMLTAALVTAANTWMKWPVSTSQLACFSVVGAALGMGAPIFWKTTIVFLCVTWVATPIVSAGLGFLFTRAADKFAKTENAKAQKFLKGLLLVGCCYAAYTLGANNTGNAVGVLYGTKLLTPMKAGFVGGIVVAIGALTWGVPILEKVAKGVVKLDLPMGVGAKLAQSVTAHIAAALGYPTSMNQALIGGMAGAGAVRGVKTMNAKAMKEIVLSWFLTPVVAGIVSFMLYFLLSHLLGVK
ncbi:MAG TPA: inorganic phosphate transporter [Verrucomicrobiae bacterium]|nr:inorganic phosphate transporter [Verrucomicrobiae bacterium]